MPLTATLQPTAINYIRGFSPNDVTYLQDSPSSPDTNNLTVIDNTATSVVDLIFEIAGELRGTQTINLAFIDPDYIGLHIEVLENGTIKHTSETAYSGIAGTVTTFSFDSSILDDRTGKNMIIRVVGHLYNNLTIDHLKAVELVVTHVTEDYIISNLKTDWTATDFYNCEDLNRVEEATKIIKDLYEDFSGHGLVQSHIFDRDEKHIEFFDSLNRIESNLSQLRANLVFPTGSTDFKTYWTHNQAFSYKDANRLEQNIEILYWYIKLNLASTPYCGNYITGQEGVI